MSTIPIVDSSGRIPAGLGRGDFQLWQPLWRQPEWLDRFTGFLLAAVDNLLHRIELAPGEIDALEIQADFSVRQMGDGGGVVDVINVVVLPECSVPVLSHPAGESKHLMLAGKVPGLIFDLENGFHVGRHRFALDRLNRRASDGGNRQA